MAAAIVNFLARESSNEVAAFAEVVLLVTTFDAVPPPALGDTTLLLFSSCKLTVTWSQTGRDSSAQQTNSRIHHKPILNNRAALKTGVVLVQS